MKKTAFAVLMALAISSPALAAPPDQASTIGPDLAWTVVERASRSADMNARADAIRAMRYVNGQDVAPFLIDALADAQWNVRKPAIIGLVGLGEQKALPLLEECMYNPSLPLDRDAMELVRAVPPAQGRAMFVKAILDAGNPARSLLVEALLEEPVETIAAWLGDCIDADQEFFAATLEKVKPGVLPALLSALAADKRGMVSLTAVKFAIQKNLPVDNGVLNGMLKSKDTAIRYMAAEKLAQQGNGDAAAVLLPLCEGGYDGEMRFLKAASMAPNAATQEKAWSMLKPETTPEMARLIYMCFPATTDAKVLKKIDADASGTDAARRPAAVRAIGRVKGTRSLPQLHDMVRRDGNREVRIAAALAIGDLGQAESVPVLGEAANDRDLDVKMAVLDALGRIYDRSVIGVASYLAFDPHPAVKKAALKAVASVNHPDAIQVLRVAADDPDPAIRYMVLAAMMRLDKTSAMARFERALLGLGEKAFMDLAIEFKDDFAPFAKIASTSHLPWARQAVLDSMKYMPTARVTLLQEMALTSNYPETRIDALLVMADLEPATAWENATALMKDPNPLIRAAAFRVIGRCGKPEGGDLLMRGIEDPDEYVQTVSAAAILQKNQKPGKDARPAGGSKNQPPKGGKPGKK